MTRRPERKLEAWLVRWDRLRARIWDRFHRMPVSEESLRWLERKSAWLCRLVPPETSVSVGKLLRDRVAKGRSHGR